MVQNRINYVNLSKNEPVFYCMVFGSKITKKTSFNISCLI